MRYGALLVAVVALSTTVGAQRRPEAGDRVKLIVREDERQVETRFYRGLRLRGELLSITDDALVVQLPSASSPVTLVRSDVRRAWVSRGPPSRMQSFWIQGIGGALLGGFESWLLYQGSFGTAWEPYGANSGREAFWTGAAYGFVVFGAMGAIWPTEYWRPVTLRNP